MSELLMKPGVCKIHGSLKWQFGEIRTIDLEYIIFLIPIKAVRLQKKTSTCTTLPVVPQYCSDGDLLLQAEDYKVP